MVVRPFADEITAVHVGCIEGLRQIPWTGEPWYAPRFPGSNEIDEGSPFLHWYNINDGNLGSLICWPEGTRLRIQTHVDWQAIDLTYYTWWLDPAIWVGVYDEAQAA